MAWGPVSESTLTWSCLSSVDSGIISISTTTSTSITTSVTTSSNTFEETFAGGSELDLTGHSPTPSATSDRFGGWTYNVKSPATHPVDSGDSFLRETFTSVGNRAAGQIGGRSRSSNNVGDSFLTAYISIGRAAVSTPNWNAGLRILVSESADSYTEDDGVNIYIDAIDGIVIDEIANGTSIKSAILYVDDGSSGTTWNEFPLSHDTGFMVQLQGSKISLWLTNLYEDSIYTNEAEHSTLSLDGSAYQFSLSSTWDDGNHRRAGFLASGDNDAGRGFVHNVYIESDTSSAVTSASVVTTVSSSTNTVSVCTGPESPLDYVDESASSYIPTRLKQFRDGQGGMDFVPTVENSWTWRVSTDRPIPIASRSAISSRATHEGRP